jgi:hypothetical protein
MRQASSWLLAKSAFTLVWMNHDEFQTTSDGKFTDQVYLSVEGILLIPSGHADVNRRPRGGRLIRILS